MNAEQLDIKLVEDIISDHQLAHFGEATKEDAILSDLQQVFLSGWQDSKGQVPPNAQEFWNYRDEFTVAQGLTTSWPISLRQLRKMRFCLTCNKFFCRVGKIPKVKSHPMHRSFGITVMNLQ